MNKPKSICRSASKALLCAFAAVSFLGVALASPRATAQAHDPTRGVVYTASNSSSGNEVVAYKRERDGSLVFQQSFPTGGTGNDVGLGGLGNQGGIVMTKRGHQLLVVNPGSDSVSAFIVQANGTLTLTDTEPSNGVLPNSVTISGRVVYVLNSADAGSIAGFTLDTDGNLTPIPGSIQPLSGMPITAPAQIQFTPDGSALVVTEKMTNLIDTFLVDGNGVASPPLLHASAGETPFGFDFSRDGYLIVSEAFGGLPDIGAVSSYSLILSDELNVITPSSPTNQTAACWIVTTSSGRFAYTTNTGSGTVSGFAINRATGQLTPLDADGVTAETGADSVPVDEALSWDSHYLYVLNSGTQEILGFRVNQSDGSLEQVTEVGGVPPFAFGLVAR
ncbi:MAG: beta-propeller fold lactonase family protein [Acidobacteriota bacterium]